MIVAIGFGVLVRQELVSTVKAGHLSRGALFLAEIPSNLKKIILSGKKSDLRAVEQRFFGKSGFLGDPLTDQAYLLLSRYDGDRAESVVELVDLTTFNVIHTWNPDIDAINNELVDKKNPELADHLIDHNNARYRMFHPILVDDGGLIFHDNGSPLVKIDYCSHLVWQNQDDMFHHSIEEDHEGYLWVPTHKFPYALDEKQVGTRLGNYVDDAIVRVSPSGDIVFEKSLSELFIENGLEYLLFSVGDKAFDKDPIHLNDIQPALSNGQFWNKGDVFLSLRHQSMVMLYRPSTNEIVWTSTGHTFHQHDVDILNENEISIFNNNARSYYDAHIVEGNNEIVIYNFATNEYTNHLSSSMHTE